MNNRIELTMCSFVTPSPRAERGVEGDRTRVDSLLSAGGETCGLHDLIRGLTAVASERRAFNALTRV